MGWGGGWCGNEVNMVLNVHRRLIRDGGEKGWGGGGEGGGMEMK